MAVDKFGPGQPAGATSQPWGPYHTGDDLSQSEPHASQPIAPTEPQEEEFFEKDDESQT